MLLLVLPERFELSSPEAGVFKTPVYTIPPGELVTPKSSLGPYVPCPLPIPPSFGVKTLAGLEPT
jgi:hypothetical protein